MRFHYLRIAVLVSILTATAPADSTSTNVKSTTLREERSLPSDRDVIAAVGSSVGDEDRGGISEDFMTVSEFVKGVLLRASDFQDKAVNGRSLEYNTMVEKGAIPHECYEEMVSNVPKWEELKSIPWKSWAFFASKFCKYRGIDPHEYIVKAMTYIYGAGHLSEIFAVAMGDSKTKDLAEKLKEVQLSLWLEIGYEPQQVFNILKIEDVWTNNIFDSPRFITWTHYLERLNGVEDQKHSVDTEVHHLRAFIDYGSLLKMLMLPKNAYHSKSAQYLRVLMSIGLDKRRPISPDKMVAMLLEGVEGSDRQFTLLFIYDPVRIFWMVYANEFNKLFPGENAPLFEKITSIYGVPKLLIMLHAAVNMPDDELSGMTLWYVNFQFSEWKMSGLTDIIHLTPDLITSVNHPAIEAFWYAYFKFYHLSGYHLSKADFIM